MKEISPKTAEIEGKSSLIAITMAIVTKAIINVLDFIFILIYTAHIGYRVLIFFLEKSDFFP